MSATQSWFEPSTVLSRARFEKIGLSWSRTTTAERPQLALMVDRETIERASLPGSNSHGDANRPSSRTST